MYSGLSESGTNSPLAGLRLQKDSIEKNTNFTSGITICTRFNYKILSRDEVFHIFSNKNGYHKIGSEAGYEESFLFLWNINWIIKDPESNKFQLWITNNWHHICLSYDRSTSHVIFVKVIFNPIAFLGQMK